MGAAHPCRRWLVWGGRAVGTGAESHVLVSWRLAVRCPSFPHLAPPSLPPRPLRGRYHPHEVCPTGGLGSLLPPPFRCGPPCSTATLPLHYPSRAVWTTAWPHDYGATNPAAPRALFCCVLLCCVLFLLGPPDDGEIASLRGFHVLLFSLCPWWGEGARTRRAASTEPDACRHLLDRARAGPGCMVGPRRVQVLTPTFFSLYGM